jgi:hypothetical protein
MPMTDAADPILPDPEPDWFREFVAGLYTRLRERIRGTGFLTRDDFEAEVRQARSSVGGAARAHRHRLARASSEAGNDAPAVACDPPVARLDKSHPVVNYREGDPDSVRRCGLCRYFRGDGTCSIVEGTIDARMTCDLYAEPPAMTFPPPEDMPAMYREVLVGETGAGPRLFAEVAFIEPPERVPILPKPGTYRHPVYGEIRLTPERIARFVANHNARVYGQDVPVLVDAEHAPKLYGAMGELGSARVEPDGSATAEVRWTRRGEQLIREGRVRYVSPQWYERWTDPVTGEEHHDVLIGLALTNQPFFKEHVLAPLVATERGEETADMPQIEVTAGMAPATEAQEAMVMSEAQFREIEERIAQQFAEQIRAEREAREAAEARVAALEERERLQQFTGEVMGRSDANDTPWAFAGEFAGDYVAILEALPAELRQKFVTIGRRIGRAFAELERQARIANETGTDARPHEGSALAEIDRLVSQHVAAGVDPVTARSRVFRERPDLYQRYREETAVRV